LTAPAKTSKDEWYAARCIFRHAEARPLKRRKHVYEERIILVRARSENQAIRKAEREAKAYLKGDDATVRLPFVEVFHLFVASIRDGSEVFSLMRSSSLNPPAYIARYFDDGSEHRR
jgi:hypothetical protein